jgi:uncharacterized membrane protein
MQASIFIARLLGPMFVVVGVALLVKPRMFRTILPVGIYPRRDLAVSRRLYRFAHGHGIGADA